MKKAFYAFILAAASLMIGCNPSEPEEPAYEGNVMNYCTVTNLGDFGDNGNTQFLVQMATLNEQGSFTTLMSAHFETEQMSGDAVPVGTFTLLEGDYVNDAYFDGSFYMTSSTTSIDYLLVTDGTIKIEQIADGYRFTVEADGYDQATGDACDTAKCRYEGTCSVKSNCYDTDWGGAVFQGRMDGGIPYWVLQLDDHFKYILNLYINTTNSAYQEGIPSGRYYIDSSMQPGHIDASYAIGPGEFGGSLVYRAKEDGTFEPHNLMIGGYVDITKKGNFYTLEDSEGNPYDVCDYEIKVVFYNGSYIPYVAEYSGAIEMFDNSAEPEYDTYLYLLYYGGNKWCIMHGVEKEDYVAVFYVYAAEDNTFEQGLSSGKYVVAVDPSPWATLPSGEPFTIVPAEIINNKLAAGYQSAVWNWSMSNVYDAITYGSMVVDNKGDGNYKIELDLGGGLGYVKFTTTFEGKADAVNDNSPKASAPALSAMKSKSPLKGNVKKTDTFKFYGPVLGR